MAMIMSICDTPKIFYLVFIKNFVVLRRDFFFIFLSQKNPLLKNLLLPWQGFYFFQTLVVDLLQTSSLLVPSKFFFLVKLYEKLGFSYL